jgi:hypothetical protein
MAEIGTRIEANRSLATPEAFLVLAGDLVRIDLPVALMERATTTGVAAANLLLRRWGVAGTEPSCWVPAIWSKSRWRRIRLSLEEGR